MKRFARPVFSLCSLSMPEVRDIMDALPGESEEPIAALGVISCPSSVPLGYSVIARTMEGSDADLWKDGLFRAKTSRYLCYTRLRPHNNGYPSNVLADLKLLGEKETLPQGFFALSETLDTNEPALKKKRLCVQLIPRESTEAAITDIIVSGKPKQIPSQYTFIGETNGMRIWYRMGRVPKVVPAPARKEAAMGTTSDGAAATASAALQQQSPPHPNLPHQKSLTLPSSFKKGLPLSMGHTQRNGADNIYGITAIDGVPFVLSEKYDTSSRNAHGMDISSIIIKSIIDIENEYEYSFVTEQNAVSQSPAACS
ncbi:unnamed protein product [Lampetra fluviatilis]